MAEKNSEQIEDAEVLHPKVWKYEETWHVAERYGS
jgi:hypothetical protein